MLNKREGDKDRDRGRGRGRSQGRGRGRGVGGFVASSHDDAEMETPASPSPPPLPSRSRTATTTTALQIPISIIFYNLAQVGLMLSSKALLARFSVSIGFAIYFVQCACSVTVLSAFERLHWIGIHPIPVGMVKYLVPVVCLAVLTEWTLQMSIEFLNLTIASAVSQLRVVAIFIGSVIWRAMQQKSISRSLFNRNIVGACLVMILAMLIAAATDPAFSMEGYMWGFASVVVGAAHTVGASKLMEHFNLKPLSTVFYSDMLSLTVLPIAMALLGEVELLSENWTMLSSVQFQSYIVGTAVLRFMAALSAAWILYVASPVAYSLVTSVARIPTVLLGIQLFNSPTHNGGIVSVVVALIGGLYYSWSTRNDHQHVHL